MLLEPPVLFENLPKKNKLYKLAIWYKLCQTLQQPPKWICGI